MQACKPLSLQDWSSQDVQRLKRTFSDKLSGCIIRSMTKLQKLFNRVVKREARSSWSRTRLRTRLPSPTGTTSFRHWSDLGNLDKGRESDDVCFCEENTKAFSFSAPGGRTPRLPWFAAAGGRYCFECNDFQVFLFFFHLNSLKPGGIWSGGLLSQEQFDEFLL